MTYIRQSWTNLETNAGTHDMLRALNEAMDLNAFFSLTSPQREHVLVRTASFCMERSGHFEDGMLNDQGLSFFLPGQVPLLHIEHVHRVCHIFHLYRMYRIHRVHRMHPMARFGCSLPAWCTR